MASKPGGKENAHAASTTRFGYTGGAKPKARGAAAAAAAAAAPPARKKAKPAIVPLREADEAAGPNTDADPYDLQKTAIEAMPDDAEQWHEVTRKFKQANKGAKWDLKSKAEKNEELIPLMKSILNKMREQRSRFHEQAEQVQSDMDTSLTQLSTLLASAAETPELEVRQKELQERVDSLETQLDAAVAAYKTATADIQDTIARAQLKDTELAELQAQITSTLEEIERTRASFRDETTKLTEALSVQNAEKAQLEAGASELQSRWQEKEGDLRTLVGNHEKERERNHTSLEQEQEKRNGMSDKQAAAAAEVTRLAAHADLNERQQTETKAELQEVRQASVVHKERADRSHARLAAVNKEHSTLKDSATKLETGVQSATAEVATLRVQKQQLVEQAAEADEKLRPLKKRKGALDSNVCTLRESNVALNAQLHTSAEELAAADNSAATEKERMTAASAAREDLETKVSKLQVQHKVTTGAVAALNEQNQALSQTVDTMRIQHSKESAEMRTIMSKNADIETELETLRSHSNMSATQQADALTQCGERCAELHKKKEQLLRESSITEDDMRKLQATADANKEQLGGMETEAAETAARRCKQWAAISELKGNVRVICRVCPNAADLQSGSVTSGPSSTGVDDTISVLPPQDSTEPVEGQAFVFDKVFPAQTPTEETYKHISDLIERAVSGEQVCVFACGHSSSGKSSMLSGTGESSELTLLQQALEHLLNVAAQDSDWTYTTTASMAVINGDGTTDPMNKSTATTPVELPLGVDGAVSLTNLTTVPAYDRSAFIAQVTDAVQAAGRVDVSHKVLTVNIHGECSKEQPVAASRTGCLRFIELAGTEHLEQPVGTVDVHTQAAHSSLTELKQVFEAIINKQQPNFDAGLLTQLSRPFLSGGGKAIMLVHVPEHPSETTYHESLRALRLATQAASCEIGLKQQNSKRTGGHGGAGNRGKRPKA